MLKLPTRILRRETDVRKTHANSYLALLPVGFTSPINVTVIAVRSYRTFSPWPLVTRTALEWPSFSVALSVELPRLAVSQHLSLWSSDFPLVNQNDLPAITRPSSKTRCF